MDRRAFVASLAAAAGLPALVRMVTPPATEWATFHLPPSFAVGDSITRSWDRNIGRITAIDSDEGTITVEWNG
jgi:hypothetical protein